MAEITISDELARGLRDLAQRQNRTVEEFLADVVERAAPQRPARIEDDPRYQAAEKKLRPRYYERARRYWAEVGDSERLSLTDEQLDEQFWLFDQDGIPRLKSDQGKVAIAPDPLLRHLDQLWDEAVQAGEEQLIGTQDWDTREILNKELPEYLLRRMQGSYDKPDSD